MTAPHLPGTFDGSATSAGTTDGGTTGTRSSYEAPPMLPPWSVHLPSYPPRVVCRFCFNDSHEIKNRKCWDCWKKSDKDKVLQARDEEKMKNPMALHFIKI
jgi:hypothetical protein